MTTTESLINNVRIDSTAPAPMSRRSMMKALAGAGAAALALRTLGPASAHHTEQTYTVSANANFRSGPGTGYSIISVITRGSTFRITGLVQNGYAQITYNGKTGWVLGSLVVEAGSSSGDPVISGLAWTSSSVNLRSGPGTSYTVLRVVPYASQVGISTTVRNGFRYVTFEGQAGWISDSYLTLTNPDDQGTNYATATANVNLRAEPNTTSAVLLVIPKGAKVQVLHTQAGDFLNANYGGKQGWVHKAYLAF